MKPLSHHRQFIILISWLLFEARMPDADPELRTALRRAREPLKGRVTTPRQRRTMAQKAFGEIHAKVETELSGHLKAWRSGKLRAKTVDAQEREWRRRSQKTIRQAYYDSYRAGKIASGGSTILSDTEQRFIEAQLRDEYKYLRGMGRKLKDDAEYRLRAAAAERVGMYADATRGMYNSGFLSGTPETAVIYWRLTPAEHCEDCTRLAFGSPYRKPGAQKPAGAKEPTTELFQVPGDGKTQCLTNCHCFLEVRFTKRQVIRSADATPTRAPTRAEPTGETEAVAFLRGEELLG